MLGRLGGIRNEKFPQNLPRPNVVELKNFVKKGGGTKGGTICNPLFYGTCKATREIGNLKLIVVVKEIKLEIQEEIFQFLLLRKIDFLTEPLSVFLDAHRTDSGHRRHLVRIESKF